MFNLEKDWKIILQNINLMMSQRHQYLCTIQVFAIVQTTRYDMYAVQSRLRDQSGNGIEPLTFECEIEASIPLAITVEMTTLPTVIVVGG